MRKTPGGFRSNLTAAMHTLLTLNMDRAAEQARVSLPSLSVSSLPNRPSAKTLRKRGRRANQEVKP